MKDPRPAFPKMVEALQEAGFSSGDSVVLSTVNMTVNCRSIRVGDVVTYRFADHGVGIAEVMFHCSVDGRCLTCISDWHIAGKTDHVWKAEVREQAMIVPSERLLQSVVYTPAAVGKTSTIMMPCVYG